MVGRYCSYLLPKQDGGKSQIQVNNTQSTRTWDALYIKLTTRVYFQKYLFSIAAEPPPPPLPLPDLVPRQRGRGSEDAVEDEIMPALRNGHDTTARTAPLASPAATASRSAARTPSPPKLSPPQQKLQQRTTATDAAGGSSCLFPENNLGRTGIR